MINFFVCDDELIARENIKKQIDAFMINSQYEYKIHLFASYNQQFYHVIEQPSTNKIYILDIQIKGCDKTGIDIAREIRKKYKDKSSLLIFITQDAKKYQNTIISETLQFFGFVDKYDKRSLKPYLKEALQEIQDQNKLSYTYRGEVYRIPTQKVTYITTNKDNICYIHGFDKTFPCPISLQALKKLLGSRFINLHRSFLINKDQILSSSFTEKSVTFQDGETINAISTKLSKKEFEQKMAD